MDVTDLTVRFGRGAGALVAVDGVNLRVESGGVLGLVGESGSGKSTIARVVAGLRRPSAGTVTVDGRDVTGRRLPARERARLIQMIFQDPYSSLNPRMTVGETIEEALAAREEQDAAARRAGARELLDLVRLKATVAQAYPRQLSGGMRQRVAIARCLAVKPKVIVADEITSALDASVQGSVLNLLRDLRAELGLSMLFISHNLAVVRYLADRIAVMHHGRIVEEGPSDEIVHAPRHEYTATLVGAVPSLDNAGTDVLTRDEP
ncbi:ABC transporter ATP-binding protein [Actinophytocola xinjiangensis]|uniref:ABC transporter ATP-binding protein n=1 Tax=Actinophytocola xinjiangensis TaxID=485602 RepID=A0A7Z0WGK9_9PSEU|nr:ABC transporter ATP-binding protein [Actinophytocola xinjiangensis]